MLIWVLNKHTGPALLGRARCRHLADRQRQANFAKRAFLSNITLFFLQFISLLSALCRGSRAEVGIGQSGRFQNRVILHFTPLTYVFCRRKNRIQILKQNCAAKRHQISLVPDQTIKQGKVLHCRQLLSREKPFDNLLSCGNSHLQELESSKEPRDSWKCFSPASRRS